MNHFPFQETPVERMNYFSKKWGINLFIKRDDIFPSAGGGSKARMLQYILYKVKANNYNVLISAGGPCSNFNRAAALMAAHLDLKFVLILYTNTPELKVQSLNLYITKLCGTEIREYDISNVPDAIELTIQEFLERGYKPYYIWGGGKSLEGSYSYFDAINNLKKQIDFKLDYVVCAGGTGTTFSGIYVGLKKHFPNTNLIGISIARSIEREIPELQILIDDLERYLKLTVSSEKEINFVDNYVLGGYGCTSPEQFELIKSVAENEGILLDPVYSGKAFYGLSRLIKDGSVKEGSNVLFWHTGSIHNLLSCERLV